MEKLKKIIAELRQQKQNVTEDDIVNVAREYLQVLVLKTIFQSKFGKALSFMGGTCLRICHDLKRYSEDLDFCLDDRVAPYSFDALLHHVGRELELLGFDVGTTINSEKTVQKAFIRVNGLPDALQLKGFRKGQKLHIKVEVDVNPPNLDKKARESFFVTRFQEVFPILKHGLPTLFAGKVLAILNRPYRRGRDFYDLIWYMTKKTEFDLNYLNHGMSQKFHSPADAYAAIRQVVQEVKPTQIIKDIRHFLEDPSEEEWIKRYQELFNQLSPTGN